MRNYYSKLVVVVTLRNREEPTRRRRICYETRARRIHEKKKIFYSAHKTQAQRAGKCGDRFSGELRDTMKLERRARAKRNIA